jgi:hypothetical protein
MPYEGQTGRLKDGTRVVYRNGQTVRLDGAGQEDYVSALPGARRLPNGDVVHIGPKGGVTVLQQGGLTGPLQVKETEDLEAVQTSNALSLQTPLDQMGQGKLKLGPVANALAPARNFLGMSDESSRNYASFRANLEKLRNDSLKLNKGVQTEGDAQRAWNELLPNLNDPELVKQRLAEIQDINARAVRLRAQAINQRRGAQGVPYLDTKQYTQGSRRNPFDLSKGESRANLPLGAFYKDPYGNLRRNDNGDKGNPKIDPSTGQARDTKPGKSGPAALSDDALKAALGL